MRSTSWATAVDSLLRPARPHLARCVSEREGHLATRSRAEGDRLRAIKRCEQRIEEARAAIFAADDGVVRYTMTSLEREWRLLTRADAEAGLMDFWARVAPPSWIDRKRWRDAEPSRRLDAATVLAADPDGVEAAEAAVLALRAALAPFGTTIGARVRWRISDDDVEHATALLAAPLDAARAVVADHGAESVVEERAERVRREVYDAALERSPRRPLLARDVGHAAYVDCIWRVAAIEGATNPVTALVDLLRTGYWMAAVDASDVTLAIPSEGSASW